MRRASRTAFAALAISAVSTVIGCGPMTPFEDSEAGEASLATRLKTLQSDLQPGSQGPEVEVLHDYLTRFGYFPNDQLARKHPAWRPAVTERPKQLQIYDEVTAQAVKALQINAGLKDTGLVDADTRAVLRGSRCGFPDNMLVSDPTNKFHPMTTKWGTTSLTWRVTNTNDVTIDQARAAVSAAFTNWTAQTGLNHTEVANGGDILITFSAIDGAGGTLAQAFGPPNGDITLDTGETWSVAAMLPAGSQDLETVILHELGHSLGLNHSGFGQASMFPFSPPADRQLDVDDHAGISSLYDTWEQLSGGGRDVAVGADGSAWIIGSNQVGSSDFGIYKWNGSAWVASDGGGVRIAVSPSGIPWIVNSAGQIWRRNSSDPAVNGWTLLSGGGKDLGIGADGSVWLVGSNPVGGGSDFGIYKWDGSAWVAADGGGVRIAVGPTGVPWLVNSAGQIWRRNSSNTSVGGWTQLPGGGRDISIQDGNYAWLIGGDTVPGGSSIFLWNEQPATAGGGPPAVARATWVQVSGAGTAIGVGPNARPWIMNSSAAVLRALR